jgi:hypothetical protein
VDNADDYSWARIVFITGWSLVSESQFAFCLAGRKQLPVYIDGKFAVKLLHLSRVAMIDIKGSRWAQLSGCRFIVTSGLHYLNFSRGRLLHQRTYKDYRLSVPQPWPITAGESFQKALCITMRDSMCDLVWQFAERLTPKLDLLHIPF